MLTVQSKIVFLSRFYIDIRGGTHKKSSKKIKEKEKKSNLIFEEK